MFMRPHFTIPLLLRLLVSSLFSRKVLAGLAITLVACGPAGLASFEGSYSGLQMLRVTAPSGQSELTTSQMRAQATYVDATDRLVLDDGCALEFARTATDGRLALVSTACSGTKDGCTLRVAYESGSATLMERRIDVTAVGKVTRTCGAQVVGPLAVTMSADLRAAPQ